MVLVSTIDKMRPHQPEVRGDGEVDLPGRKEQFAQLSESDL